MREFAILSGMRGIVARRVLIGFAVLIVLAFSTSAKATRFTSTSYIIDASVANSFGGQMASDSYKLVGSGGESIVGTASSGSYKMGMGYTAQLMTSIQLSLDKSELSFTDISPGTPQTQSLKVSVNTDAPGYLVAVHQNGTLDDGNSNTIPDISGSIASPADWVDGTTTGLGFTITSATAGVPVLWSSGAKYAAMPTGTPTTFFTRSGKPNGEEELMVRYKLGVDMTIPTGTYTNIATFTGTMSP